MSRLFRGSWLTGAAILCGLWLGPGVAPDAVAQLVSFNPAESIPTNPEFVVHLDIDCAAELVKGVEVRVVYDPFLLRLDSITPGTWYTDSGQTFYFYDYTGITAQGTIHFASAVLEGTLSGAGPLAVCHFTMRDFGISPLVFQDVDVRGLANADLGFAHSTGDRIILDPVVEVEVRTFGRLKAIYR